METLEFELHEEYIELIKLLKVMQICMSGGEAKIRVEMGEVRVDGEVEYRKRRKLRQGNRVSIDEIEITLR